MLARIYMTRSDVAYGVRSASLHVWKTVVTNTPKTLGEVLPALMQQIIASLADPSESRHESPVVAFALSISMSHGVGCPPEGAVYLLQLVSEVLLPPAPVA